MLVLDANLLIYAHHADNPHHVPARRWLAERLADVEIVGLPWQTLLAFLRITTHRRLFSSPLDVGEATEIVRRWGRHPRTRVLHPGPQHAAIFLELIHRHDVTGSLVTDAHLAAIALEHGATLCTNDDDFRRFDGLEVAFPLQQPGWLHEP